MLNEKDLPVGADWRQKMLSVQKYKKISTARGVCEKITASSRRVVWLFAGLSLIKCVRAHVSG
jgi:hypothetical protein